MSARILPVLVWGSENWVYHHATARYTDGVFMQMLQKCLPSSQLPGEARWQWRIRSIRVARQTYEQLGFILPAERWLKNLWGYAGHIGRRSADNERATLTERLTLYREYHDWCSQKHWVHGRSGFHARWDSPLFQLVNSMHAGEDLISWTQLTHCREDWAALKEQFAQHHKPVHTDQ